MKTYRGKGGIALLILYLGARWRRVDITPRPTYPRYPLRRELVVHHRQSVRPGEKYLAIAGIQTPASTIVATVSTGLHSLIQGYRVRADEGVIFYIHK